MFDRVLKMPVRPASHPNQIYRPRRPCRVMEPLKTSLLILSRGNFKKNSFLNKNALTKCFIEKTLSIKNFVLTRFLYDKRLQRQSQKKNSEYFKGTGPSKMLACSVSYLSRSI